MPGNICFGQTLSGSNLTSIIRSRYQKFLRSTVPPRRRNLWPAELNSTSHTSLTNWGLNDQGEHGRHYSKVNLIFDQLGLY